MSDGVTKLPSPAQGSIGLKTSVLSMIGAAAAQIDPMRGRFVPESEAKNVQMAVKAHELAIGGRKRTQSTDYLEPGHRVYHKIRKETGIVAKASTDGKRIKVIFAGECFFVQVVNLTRVGLEVK